MKTGMAILIGLVIVSSGATAGVVEEPPVVTDEMVKYCTPHGAAVWRRNYADLLAWQKDLEFAAADYNQKRAMYGNDRSRKSELRALLRSVEAGIADYAKCLNYFKERLHALDPRYPFDPGPSLTTVEMLNLLENSREAIDAVYDSNHIRALRQAAETSAADPLIQAAFAARVEKEMRAIESQWPPPTNDVSWVPSPCMPGDAEQAERDRALLGPIDPKKMEAYSLKQIEGLIAARRDARQRLATRAWIKRWEEDKNFVYKSSAPGATFEEKMKDPAVADEYRRRLRETDAQWRNDLKQARYDAIAEYADADGPRYDARLHLPEERKKWLPAWHQALREISAIHSGDLAHYMAQQQAVSAHADEPPTTLGKLREKFDDDVAFRLRAAQDYYNARIEEAKAAAAAFEKKWETAKRVWKQIRESE